MGLDNASVKFLCAARALGVDFDRTAMIGRQWMSAEAAELARVFETLEVDEDAEVFLRRHEFGEAFFELLGASTVDSVDVSAYENATIIHDMNRPLPAGLAERYTAVHDGGTLEHVFNVPQALANCMEMVAVGGHFTQVNIANNFMGHGFWQFSPELIYRVFSPVNGFQIKAVLLHEVVPGGAWYAVADPDEVRSRVELCNRRPTYILTIAQRVSRAPIFATTPQQSDYAAAWDRGAGIEQQPAASAAATSTIVRQHAATGVRKRLRAMAARLSKSDAEPAAPAFNAVHYRRLDEQALLRGRLKEAAD